MVFHVPHRYQVFLIVRLSFKADATTLVYLISLLISIIFQMGSWNKIRMHLQPTRHLRRVHEQDLQCLKVFGSARN